MIATYASNPSDSKGRLYQEKECSFRNNYQRDRDRIIHSASFRRLEYKTQVFVNHEGDHYRTRLTHSLEVAQIARSISKILGGCEELTEALALAHDLGHPPFGHAGEDALNKMMNEFGGFDHNAQAIKILTSLEHRYVAFDGLNLSWETLEGIAKHNGPLIGELANKTTKENNLIINYLKNFDLELAKYPSLEAQIASFADDIAYNSHDLEDGIRANLFEVEELYELPIVGEIAVKMMNDHYRSSTQRIVHEIIRKLIKVMINDLIEVTKKNINNFKIQSANDIRNLKQNIVYFSPVINQANLTLKQFLLKKVYRHYKINRMTSRAKRVVEELFQLYFREPECLPLGWNKLINKADELQKAIVISDFIAGMTDRFALKEHRELFSSSY